MDQPTNHLVYEAEEHKTSYLGACKTIADMHAAAVGEVRGPIRGVVEDIADVRARMLAAEEALTHQTQETVTWRATANALDAGGPGTPRHRAEQAEAAIERVQQACHDLPHEHARRILAAIDGTEQDVTRVIALYERWVKAGPPLLGTPVSRWWDARLVELRAALDGTKDPATCTATIAREDHPNDPDRCIAAAGHYNEQHEPTFTGPDRSPGGWHTNGRGRAWTDRSALATPHHEQATTEDPS